MKQTIPLVKDLVLVGGGHSHALLLRAWGMKPVPGARLTVINPAPTAPYTGMLPGFVAGHYTREEVALDLVRLARFAGARLILGAATEIDPDRGIVTVPGHGEIAYDVASLDVGITSEMPQVPGFAEHAMPAKPMDVFAKSWVGFVASKPVQPSIVVIGGGVAGVELAMAAQHRLPDATLAIVDRGEALSALPKAAARAMTSVVKARGIQLIEGLGVQEVKHDCVVLDDGSALQADVVIGAGGARPYSWLGQSGLTMQDGYVAVDRYLRSVSHRNVYAAGDCAYLSFDPRPKAGVYAVRAGPILTHNLRVALTGGARRAFRPQKDYLKLISLGAKEAFAEKASLRMQGAWVWRWKDQIDRAFMRKVIDLPKMQRERPPVGAARGVAKSLSGPALCGGCAAKVGPAALKDALASLPGTKRADIIQGIGDDAAVLQVGDVQQVITTDHLRRFSLDPALVARVAALHSAGDILAMGAEPQTALAHVIMPQMAPPLQSRTLREIMHAAGEAFADLGVEIIGGHTSEGAELSIGFTVTGIAHRPPIGQTEAQPGDLLVLTRPIGSGVLLAAEMAYRAEGGHIADLWRSLVTPQLDEAADLARVAHAMTDVTGFGLAGHLANICRGSGVGASLQLAEIPVFDGARHWAARGVASSLFAANRDSMSDMMDVDGADPLLFDPQTAGGLLASIPPSAKTELLHAIPAARVIGQITDRQGVITLH